MARLTPRIFAVVEIGSDLSGLLLLGGVFIATFILVLAAYWLIVRSKPGPQGTTTWQLDMSSRLPVSKATFDQIASTTAKALSRPKITPETRTFLRRLDHARGALAGVYRIARIAMIAMGLFGVGVSVWMFRQADSGNMMGLPAAIILLISLGAIS